MRGSLHKYKVLFTTLAMALALVTCRPDDPRKYFLVKDLLTRLPCVNEGRIGEIKYYYDGSVYNIEIPFSEDTLLNLLVRSYDPYPHIQYPEDMDGGDATNDNTTPDSVKLETQQRMIDTRKNGIDKGYYPNGKVKWEFTYKNGKKNGLEKEYYDNGNLSWETPYKNDKRNGIQREFYENGKVEWEIPYTMDRINGAVKELYESGVIKEDASFSNDHKAGIEKAYYESGALMGEYPFSRASGKLNGVAKQYYETGELFREVTYSNGQKNGSERVYDKSGKLVKEVAYVNGKRKNSALHY